MTNPNIDKSIMPNNNIITDIKLMGQKKISNKKKKSGRQIFVLYTIGNVCQKEPMNRFTL